MSGCDNWSIDTIIKVAKLIKIKVHLLLGLSLLSFL